MPSIELSSAQYYEETHNPNDHPIKIKDVDWTNGLTLLAFACILFGVWGLGTAAHGANTVLESNGKLKIDRSVTDYEQIRMLQTVAKVKESFRAYNLFFYISKFVLSVALIASAGLLLMRLPFARRLMITTCGAAICFHVLGAVCGFAMFIQISGQIEESGRRSLYSVAGDIDDIDSIVNEFMNGVAFGALLATFTGMLIKGGIYARMILYLSNPLVRAVFGENPYPECDDMQREHLGHSPA